MPAPETSRSGLPILLAALLCAGTCSSLAAQNQGDRDGDPPNRVGRIGWAQGAVSLEPSGSDFFSAAETNYPMSAGDRLFADINALSEIQTSGLAVRLGNGADVTITSLTDAVAQFALGQGSIRVRTHDLYAPQGEQAVVEIDTPNATILVQQPGDIRVDTYPDQGTTIVTVNSGAAEVSGQGFDQSIGPNQSIQLNGYDQVQADYVGLLPPDNLDQFDQQRERQRLDSPAFRNHYVDPGMIGAADLDQYGDWQPAAEYGPVWFPRKVAYGWSPYSVGHWAVIPPWGYTWVDNEPWGFAPFHYGRWNNFGGRWGWVPGPPPSVFAGEEFHGRPPRPVYSPALVAFVGGPGFSLSLSFGGGGGGGVTAWFPLGPREPYVPWYHTSPAYVNRVNVTNIYTTNVTEVHNTYINKTTTVYNTTNVTYVNRNTATVAVKQAEFTSGHPITPTQTIKLDPALTRQLAQAPVVQRSIPTPPRMAVPPAAAVQAKAVPPVAARPVVQTKEGFQRAGAPPAPTPLKAPTPRPETTATRATTPAPRTPPTIAPAKSAPGNPARPTGNPATAQPGRVPATQPARQPEVARPGALPAQQPTRSGIPPANRPGDERPAYQTGETPAKPMAEAPIERAHPQSAPIEQPDRTPVARPGTAPMERPGTMPTDRAPIARPTTASPARPGTVPADRTPIERPATPPPSRPANRPLEPELRPATPPPVKATAPPPVVRTVAPKPAAPTPPAPQPHTVPAKPAVQTPPPQHPVPAVAPKKTPPPAEDDNKRPKDEKTKDQKPS